MLKTPQDAPGDDANNLATLCSFVAGVVEEAHATTVEGNFGTPG